MIALEQAIAIAEASEAWDVQDDLCDCTYQRIGYWYNPYVGEVLETRLCCVWAELEKMWPEHFRRNQVEPVEWNGEADMPRGLWYRQLANVHGMSIQDVRREFGDAESPKGMPVKEKPRLFLRWGNDYVPLVLG